MLGWGEGLGQERETAPPRPVCQRTCAPTIRDEARPRWCRPHSHQHPTRNSHAPPRPDQLCDLYETDSLFDKFDVCCSGDGRHMVTGTYSNLFRVIDRQNDAGSALLESSRDPNRRRLQNAARVRGGSRRGRPLCPAARGCFWGALWRRPARWRGVCRWGVRERLPTTKPPAQPIPLQPSRFGLNRARPRLTTVGEESVTTDLASKVLRLSWHPGAPVIATAAENSLYIFQGAAEDGAAGP